ncbi:MAG: N-acetylmuramoyl-L-alanine amidase [candidate division WOR-3 bacterium]
MAKSPKTQDAGRLNTVDVAGVQIPTRKVSGIEYVGLHHLVQVLSGRFWQVGNRFIVVLPGESLAGPREFVFMTDSAVVLSDGRRLELPVVPLLEEEQLFVPVAVLTAIVPEERVPILRRLETSQRGDTLVLSLKTEGAGRDNTISFTERSRSSLEYLVTLACRCDSSFRQQLALFSLTSGSRLVQRITVDTAIGTTLHMMFRQPAAQRVLQTERGVDVLVWPRPLRRVTKILLDPGHGGPDPGALGRLGTQEKTIVLDIALRLAKKLRAKGFEVVVTHDTDRYQSLADRSKMARDIKADLFISIHANWAENRLANGFESYFLSEAKTDWERAVAARENAALEFDLPADSKKDALELILADMAQNEFLFESSQLAAAIQEAVVRNGRVGDRGVRQANFYVLRNTFMPAVLLECGYLSNKSEEKLLRKPEHRERLAQCICEGVVAFARQFEQRINGNNRRTADSR